MPSLTIKGIPQSVLVRLRARARRNRRSLNSEVILILTESDITKARTYADILKDVNKAHSLFSGNLNETAVNYARKAGRK